MVYLFHISSAEKPDFSLEVALNSRHTFADFSHCIQEVCEYSQDQLAAFFIQGKSPGKPIEISQLDLGPIGIPTAHVMRKTLLCQFLYKETQRLLYVFDFFQDRSFYIELIQISMDKNLMEPSVTTQKGKAPSQLLDEELHEEELSAQAQPPEERSDYGDLDDYNEIYGEMENLMEGL